MSYAGKSDFKQAILLAERGVNLSPRVNFLRGILGAVYAMAGQRAAAERVLGDLLERARDGYVGPMILSWIQCHLGNSDEAFKWLDRAVAERACSFSFGLGAPMYDPIRSDPRFQELRTKVGLTQ